MSTTNWRSMYYAFVVGLYNGVIHGFWPGMPISIAIVTGAFLFEWVMEKVSPPS